MSELYSYAINNDFDYVCASYAMRAKDIQSIRDCLGPQGAHINIIAKIESLEALHNFEELLGASDAIMICRIDIGLELPPEKLMLA